MPRSAGQFLLFLLYSEKKLCLSETIIQYSVFDDMSIYQIYKNIFLLEQENTNINKILCFYFFWKKNKKNPFLKKGFSSWSGDKKDKKISIGAGRQRH